MSRRNRVVMGCVGREGGKVGRGMAYDEASSRLRFFIDRFSLEEESEELPLDEDAAAAR